MKTLLLENKSYSSRDHWINAIKINLKVDGLNRDGFQGILKTRKIVLVTGFFDAGGNQNNTIQYDQELSGYK